MACLIRRIIFGMQKMHDLSDSDFGELLLEYRRPTACLIRRVIFGIQKIHDLSDSEGYFGKSNTADTRRL